jgi:putative ABC transport system permease protein
MSNVLSDLKHGVRVLLRTPLFTICTIAALAIGIGATTALFSVVHALLIKPLPYKNADSLVVVWEHNLPRNRPRNVISPAISSSGASAAGRSRAWRRSRRTA